MALSGDVHGAESEQWRKRADDRPFPRTSVGLLWHQSAVIELVGRKGLVQAPESGAVVRVEQDEHLGVVKEVDKGQRLPEVDLFRSEHSSVDILELFGHASEVEPDVLDRRVLLQESADGVELVASLAGAHIRIARRKAPRQCLRNARDRMTQKGTVDHAARTTTQTTRAKKQEKKLSHAGTCG